MAEFSDAIMKRVIDNEGSKFENDPDDEPTKYGIVADDIRECVEDGIILPNALDNIVEFIKNIDEPLAKTILKHQYFDKLKLSKIVPYQTVAEKIFDMSMLIGRKAATMCAQRACRSVLQDHQKIVEDGVMGTQTLSAINLCFDKQFLAAFRSECAGYCRAIILCKPKKEKYVRGWVARSYQ